MKLLACMGMSVAVLRECKHLTYYVVHEVIHVLKLKFVNIKLLEHVRGSD